MTVIKKGKVKKKVKKYIKYIKLSHLKTKWLHLSLFFTASIDLLSYTANRKMGIIKEDSMNEYFENLF